MMDEEIIPSRSKFNTSVGQWAEILQRKHEPWESHWRPESWAFRGKVYDFYLGIHSTLSTNPYLTLVPLGFVEMQTHLHHNHLTQIHQM